MYPEKSSLSIRLTEPVVSLRSTLPERAFRHHDGEMLPPAIVRGLFTLTLAKPTKISSIELELEANATTRYAQGAGPSRIDVTEQYKVHSASTVIFKAGPVPQVRQYVTSTRPYRAQLLDNHTGSDAQHGAYLNEIGRGPLQAPSGTHPVTRSASLDPQVRRRLSSDDLEIDHDRNSQRDQISIDPAPSYHSLYPPTGQHSTFLSADSYSSAAGRSQSVASSSRITEPRSSSILPQSNQTPDIPCGSPTFSVHSIHDFPLSRTSSIEEVSQDDGESFDTSPPYPGNVAYYGLSRIATSSSGGSSEQDHKGRSHSRSSFRKVVHIFDAVKDRMRSRSPRAGSLPRSDEQGRGRSLMKGKGKARASTHDVGHTLPRIEAAEPSVADDVNDQSGWVIFPEGTYTYPIFFTIPNNSPPTIKVDHGSLIWRVKAEVKRPSAFKSKMTAQKEVIVVCLPNPDDLEVRGIDLQRQWDGQLQYRVQIAGRGFPVGGKVPFQLTIMPLAKIKIHSIFIYLDEQTAYYTRAETEVRSDVIRRATLLSIRHNNSGERYSEPILPLASDEPDVFRKSPLYRFLGPGEDESEVASSLMGPGPWMIRHQLRVPDSCSILHPSNRTKGSNVMVSHTLKIVLRVEKEEGTVTTGRKKLYDIVILTPIQILSCHCTSEWTSLPRYDEALRSAGDFPENTSMCPCRIRHQTKARARFHATDPLPAPLQRVASLPTTKPNSPGGLPTFPPDSFASRTHLHELLMCGFVSERGEAPPSYEHVFAE